jgi:hypothetical protein
MNCKPSVMMTILSVVLLLTTLPVSGQQSDNAQTPADAQTPEAIQTEVMQPGQIQPEAPQPEAIQPGTLQLDQAVICQDVVERAPVAIGDVYSKDIGRLFCFTRVLGGSADSMIIHNWYYKGNLQASVSLPVRGAQWRTWSSKRIDPNQVGEWMVEILSEDGTPLNSLFFFIQ